MRSNRPIRVMIVDDHPIVRFGLKLILEQSEEFDVVGQAVDGEHAVRMAGEVSPDVVLMDVKMPNMDGLEACREIMDSIPETRVVMLSASTAEASLSEALAAGAAGYMHKETDREHLVTTLRQAYAGRPGVPSGGDALSQQERRILIAFAEGMTHATIAQALALEPDEVAGAFDRIQQKLGVRTFPGLVRWAKRHRLQAREASP